MILNTLNTGAYAKLIVTLDGDAKLYHSDIEGHYIMASTTVNGKQTWIHDQGSNAIWYDKENTSWNIGHKENLGINKCGLHSTNDATGPEEATTWEYHRNGEWKSISNIFGSPSMY